MPSYNFLICLEQVKKFVCGGCGGAVGGCKPILVFSFCQAEQNVYLTNNDPVTYLYQSEAVPLFYIRMKLSLCSV